MDKLYTYFLLFLLLFVSQIILAQTTTKNIILSSQTSSIDVIPFTYILDDPEKDDRLTEVLQHQGFIDNASAVYLKYHNTKAVWVKFTVTNQNPGVNSWILEVNNPTINKITFYKPDALGSYDAVKTGDALSYNSRDIKTRDFSFELNIPYNSTKTYYIYLDSEGDAINVPLKIWSPTPFIVDGVHERYLLGLFYGSVMFIIIFHLFLYFKLRDNSLIWYMLYILGIAGFQLCMDGYTSKYLFPTLPWLPNKLMVVTTFISAASLIRFLQIYVNTEESIPKYHKVLRFAFFATLFLMALSFISQEVFIYITVLANYWAPSMTLVVIVGAILAFRNEPILAKYFIIAFAVLIIGIVLATMRNFGNLVDLAEHGLKLGVAGQAVILAFALAVRFKMIDEKTQEVALTHLKKLNQLKDDYSAELELTVKERTTKLEKSNNDIKDSIRYAKRIQSSILPSLTELTKVFDESYIYYRPKDIVSGDFYWHRVLNKCTIVAAVDCTGHGVPGAFMSMLGASLLNEIVETRGITQPDKVLELLNAGVRKALNQDKQSGISKDGMDLALLTYYPDLSKVQFSGAKRPLYHFSGPSLNVIKGDKKSIGGGNAHKASNSPYELHELEVQPGDSFVLFTDGFPDQFGGPENRKFMTKRFKELLAEIQHLPYEVQSTKLDEAITQWRGSSKQIDDILVIGLKV